MTIKGFSATFLQRQHSARKEKHVCVCGTDMLVCSVTEVFLCLGLHAMSDVWLLMPDHHRPLAHSDRWGTG